MDSTWCAIEVISMIVFKDKQTGEWLATIVADSGEIEFSFDDKKIEIEE